MNKITEETKVVLGTYQGHQELEIKYLPNDDNFLNSPWFESGLSYYSPSEMYYHWLLDDMLGLYWMIRHYNVEHGTHALFFSYSAVKKEKIESLFPILNVFDWKTMQPTCYKKFYAGPAGRNYGGPVSFQLFLFLFFFFFFFLFFFFYYL